MANLRTPVPTEISTEVLFAQGHTCCVCREPGKAVQLHHIDENPTNHSPENLAVLCLEDHERTQLRGGFGKKLLAPEVKQLVKLISLSGEKHGKLPRDDPQCQLASDSQRYGSDSPDNELRLLIRLPRGASPVRYGRPADGDVLDTCGLEKELNAPLMILIT